MWKVPVEMGKIKELEIENENLKDKIEFLEYQVSSYEGNIIGIAQEVHNHLQASHRMLGYAGAILDNHEILREVAKARIQALSALKDTILLEVEDQPVQATVREILMEHIFVPDYEAIFQRGEELIENIKTERDKLCGDVPIDTRKLEQQSYLFDRLKQTWYEDVFAYMELEKMGIENGI